MLSTADMLQYNLMLKFQRADLVTLSYDTSIVKAGDGTVTAAILCPISIYTGGAAASRVTLITFIRHFRYSAE